MLDELGYVLFSKVGAELLFKMVSRAYERTSLMVTTNLRFEEWAEVMGNERTSGALLDRLTHRVHILETNGESCRLRQARKAAPTSANKVNLTQNQEAVVTQPKEGETASTQVPHFSSALRRTFRPPFTNQAG